MTTTPIPTGWRCPSCGVNYAPTVTECRCSAHPQPIPWPVIVPVPYVPQPTAPPFIVGDTVPNPWDVLCGGNVRLLSTVGGASC